MEDYYALLGVHRSASSDELDQSIRAELRRWQRRTASPDLARRQEAERQVHLLAEARAVLLDDRQRHRYDLKLATNRRSTSGDGSASPADLQQPPGDGRSPSSEQPPASARQQPEPDGRGPASVQDQHARPASPSRAASRPAPRLEPRPVIRPPETDPDPEPAAPEPPVPPSNLRPLPVPGTGQDLTLRIRPSRQLPAFIACLGLLSAAAGAFASST
jgi:curved DNA-binding protein CbpA